MTETSTSTATRRDGGPTPRPSVRELISRITRLEITVGAVIALIMASLVVIEPNILEAPFENSRTVLFTFGGTALAAIALVAMLRFRVPAVVRVLVLVVPFAIVNWWLISPYFTDEVVDEGFSTSIAEQLAAAADSPGAPADSVTPSIEGESTSGSVPAASAAPPPTESVQNTEDGSANEPVAETESVQNETTVDEPATPPTVDEPATPPSQPPAGDGSVPEDEAPTEAPAEEEPSPPPAPSGPVLLGAGQFVGLAGHSGTGIAGIFENPDGSLVIRFESFDIQNGPDLEVYLVPGADQISLQGGSIHLGELKGNVGDQTYELPPGTELPPGAYTVLVWCEAFSVEFVGATIDI